MLLLLLLVVLLSVAMDNLSPLLTTPPMATLLLESMLLTLLVLSTLPRGLLMLMPTMVPMAWAMLDMVDMEDTMAPTPPLLLLVVLLSVAMDNQSLLLTMPPMAMLLLGSMLLTLLVPFILPRGLLMLMPTMEDMESTWDPRHPVSPPSPMLDSLCKDMPRDMAMDSMAITKKSLFIV